MKLKVEGQESTNNHRKKTGSKKRAVGIIILDIFFALLITTIIFLSSFASLIFNEDFYQNEHVKNNVYDSLADANERTHEIITFLDEGTELGSKFNQKEKLHMHDVKNLVDNGFLLYYFCIILLISVIIYYVYTKKKFNHVLIYSGGIIIGFCLVSFLLQSEFQYFFIKFHELFFDNNLWLLNPATDKLIILLPEQFFVDFVKNVYARSFMAGVGLFFVGFVRKKIYNLH